MSYYSEYISMALGNNFSLLTKERKKQLKIIKELRGEDRDILVYASDLNKNQFPISIVYDDLIAIHDQMPKSKNKSIDVIIETPGGSAEVVEDFVRILRERYDEVSVIIPGYAKSAGTIFAMSADEILMGCISALGPIDAQIFTNGKIFSAGAFLKGFADIKEEIKKNNRLDLAYIPILQQISPGEIEHCKNAQNFSQILVSTWLYKYKFKNWNNHRKSGVEVTDIEKKEVAENIAKNLCDNNKWKTHGRSLKINDLTELGLEITNFSENEKLNEAIMRYYTLLKMSFEGGIYKIFETTNTQIYKMIPVSNIPVQQSLFPLNNDKIKNVRIDLECHKCKEKYQMVVAFDDGTILKENEDCIPFPENDEFICKKCSEKIFLGPLKADIERQFGKRIVKPTK